ncbi:hypothetical protein PVK06_007404 [Gossypium arboreum]|uniref:Uncharacterized protein n=1 Tax=Gossypium arboreum TaxID=29729 RepID=A0ABR0QI26_GOSAR|nr:hypothetical protein PVK06_007404 [Gossypium arboreum]
MSKLAQSITNVQKVDPGIGDTRDESGNPRPPSYHSHAPQAPQQPQIVKLLEAFVSRLTNGLAMSAAPRHAHLQRINNYSN